MEPLDYWKECIGQTADDIGLKLTEEQLNELALAVQGSHENYGMAYYSPAWTDRMSDIENEYKRKLKDLESSYNKYRRDAEFAVKQAYRLNQDARVVIMEDGEVRKI